MQADSRRPLLCPRMIASALAACCLTPALLLASAPLTKGFFAPHIVTDIPRVSRGGIILGTRGYGLSASRRRKFSIPSLAMGLASPGDAVKVVVCGPSTGIAGLVAGQLSTAGGSRQVILAEETQELEGQLVGAKVVVGSSDGGPDAEEAPPGLAEEIVTTLPPETQYLIWVDSPEGREAGRRAKKDVGFIGGLLGGGFKEPLEAVQSAEDGGIKCVVVHTGRLFGAAGGAEPVPFLTGPKAEPVLDESITRQAVLLGPGTVLSSPKDAATKRSSVVEAIDRLLRGPERRSGAELSVVSVEGFAATDEEWEEEIKRLDDSEGLAVFSLDFEAIERKDQLGKWLADSWGPATLRKSTAAMLRSGARPVAVSPTPQGLDLVWETLTEDLTAVQAGKLSIVVNEQPPGIRVVRVAGPGQPQGKALSGEEEIVQSLLEGINTVAYPKAMVKRKAPKVSLVGAAPRSSGGAAVAKTASAAAAAPSASGSKAAPAPASATPAAPTAADVAPPSSSPKGRGRRSGGKRKSS